MARTLTRLLMTAVLALLVAACSQFQTNIVPTTGNSANDPTAAGNFVRDIPGYISTPASSIASAISTVTGGASLATGNLLVAGAIAQIDGMISCYSAVGAVAAKVYVQSDIATVLEGQIPSVGAMAVVNATRAINNFLPCALGSGPQGLSAQQAGIEPCGSAGQFIVNGETLLYVYAATNPALCTQFQAMIPA
jgi:hypothetical protein